MSAGRPQDHLPKKIVDATNAQAANLAQKAIIDNVVVKFTRILAEVKKVEDAAYVTDDGDIIIEGSGEYWAADVASEAITEIKRTLRLTRDDVAEIRLQPEHTFPDEEVQAIITEAVDKITAVILRDGEA